MLCPLNHFEECRGMDCSLFWCELNGETNEKLVYEGQCALSNIGCQKGLYGYPTMHFVEIMKNVNDTQKNN